MAQKYKKRTNNTHESRKKTIFTQKTDLSLWKQKSFLQ